MALAWLQASLKLCSNDTASQACFNIFSDIVFYIVLSRLMFNFLHLIRNQLLSSCAINLTFPELQQT